jgi:Tfp pilus assembly protein PilF
MRRRLNVKGLLVLLGGLVLSGLAVHFLHGFQVKRQAGILLKQEERAENAKEYRVAIDYLRRYLGFRPDDTDALAHYGRLLAREDIATTPRAGLFAISILESVLRRDPERDEERRLLVDLGFRRNQYREVQYHIEYLLGLKKVQDAKTNLAPVGKQDPNLKKEQDEERQIADALKQDPKKAELVGKLAECHEAQRRYKEARRFYELAVRNMPQEAANYVGLARLLREQTDEVRKTPEKLAALHQQADQLMDNLVKANPRKSGSYVARARYRRHYPLPAGKEATLEAAERDLQQALQLAGDDAEVLLALAELAEDQKRPSQARVFLVRGQKKYPGDWRMYHALCRLARGLNRSDQALTHLNEGLKKLPDRLELLWERAQLLVSIGSSEAPAAIDRLESKGVPQAERDVLSAQLLTRERPPRWAEALKLLIDAHAQLLGRENREQSTFLAALVEQSNFLLTQCYEALGDPYRAQNIYLRLLASNPRSPEARLGLARTHLALGQSREAESRFRQLAALPTSRGALAEVARLVLQRNLRKDDPDWDEIDDSLKTAERLQPRPVMVGLLRADELMRRAEREANAKTKKQLTDEARDALVVNLLGGMPVCMGLLRPEMLPFAALPLQRSLAALWVGLSVHAEQTGHAAKGLQVLDEADRHFGDLVELRQARMRYWARQRGPEAVKALAGLESSLATFSPEERRSLRTTLALAYTSVGQNDRAQQIWQELAKDYPDDWSVRLLLFNQALEKNDDGAMDTLLEQLRRIEKEDGVLWRDATLRRLLAKAASLAKPTQRREYLVPARQLTAEIAARWPGWVGVTQFEAQIEDLDGFPDKALPKYRAAIDKGAANVQSVWRAMEILNAKQQYREASALRAKLPTRGQFSAGLEHEAALASFRASDEAEALVRAERAAAGAPKDHRPRLLLGQIYWRMGQPEKALSALLKARDLGDRAPETWLTLIGFLIATERKEQAKTELSKAESKLTDVRGKAALAQCYEFMGENEKAKELYERSEFTNSSDFLVRRAVAVHYLRVGNAEAATQHLNFLVKAAATKEPSTVVWARGMLAILVALNRDRSKTQEALALLKESMARDSTAAVGGRRVQAAILATQGNRRDREKAIRLLQGLIDDGQDQPADRLLLAQLHEANKDWLKARQQLMGLLKTPGGVTATNLVAYVSALLRHDEVEEAERALGQLEKLPSTAGTLPFVSLKARVWHRRGKEKEAVALLIDHATKRGQVFGQVGAILENLKEYRAAEQMYKIHAEKAPNPSAMLAYAGFLGRHKRYHEALGLCERAWAKAPAAAVVNTCLSILGAAEDNKAVQGRVEQQFLAALKKAPQSVLLRLSLANLRVLQREYEDAEKIYRDLLREDPINAEDPGNVLARNNFAWLLVCQRKNVPEALKLMEQAIDRAGPRPTLLDTQALVFLQVGKVADAVKILEGLVVEAPQKAVYRFHLAQAQSANRNRQGARQSLLQAVRLGLKESTLHPLERQVYAQLLHDLGIPKNALAQE